MTLDLQETARRMQEVISAGALNLKPEQQDSKVVISQSPAEVLWNIGELEFEAYMRMMDSAVRFTHSFNHNDCIIISFVCKGLSDGIFLPFTYRQKGLIWWLYLLVNDFFCFL